MTATSPRASKRHAQPATIRMSPRMRAWVQPAVALLIARLLAHRLHVATTYLADIKRQYADHGNHLAMVGDVLESMINLTPANLSPGSDRSSDRSSDRDSDRQSDPRM